MPNSLRQVTATRNFGYGFYSCRTLLLYWCDLISISTLRTNLLGISLRLEMVHSVKCVCLSMDRLPVLPFRTYSSCLYILNLNLPTTSSYAVIFTGGIAPTAWRCVRLFHFFFINPYHVYTPQANNILRSSRPSNILPRSHTFHPHPHRWKSP